MLASHSKSRRLALHKGDDTLPRTSYTVQVLTVDFNLRETRCATSLQSPEGTAYFNAGTCPCGCREHRQSRVPTERYNMSPFQGWDSASCSPYRRDKSLRWNIPSLRDCAASTPIRSGLQVTYAAADAIKTDNYPSLPPIQTDHHPSLPCIFFKS